MTRSHPTPDAGATAGRPAATARSADSPHYATYEQFETSIRTDTPAYRALLDATLATGWRTPGGRLEPITPPVRWSRGNRSTEYHLHAWEPLSTLLRGYDLFGDDRYFARALALALDWIERFAEPLLAAPRAEALDAARSGRHGMAWYDMAAGLRAHRLAYIADVVARDRRHSRDLEARLTAALVFHMDLLARDDFFVGHTNHGLYQALGQMAAARRFPTLPGFEGHARQAEERLRVMIDRSFFPSGVHREHSPGYHHMILGSLLGARAEGMLSAETNALLDRAGEALGWMLDRGGVLAPLGDTDPTPHLTSPQSLGRISDPSALYLLSGGRYGTPPPDGCKAYPDAGMVFVRHGTTYLAQIAGFHSRTHKHADHLSFLWSEGGAEILIDPGRFGYIGRTEVGSDLHRKGHWYADPRRIYVEKTRAHNCVEIDGQDYPRARTKPFGSALIAAGRQGPLYVTSCEAVHFRRIRHRRDLVVAPGDFVLVLDWLFDRSGERHAFKQWFQLSPRWEPAANEHGAAFQDGDATIWIADLLDPRPPIRHRGETEPDMSGWRSDAPESLVPATSLHFDRTGDRALFATLVLTRRGTPSAATRTNATLRAGRFAWCDDRGERTVTVRRDEHATIATLA